jgi:biopolymer transport protein ExbD
MKISSTRNRRFDLSDSATLSDLAFLLIIYFIVIAVFNANSGFLLGLPRKNSTKIVNSEELVRAELDSAGRLLYKGLPIESSRLETIIEETRRERPNLTFLLRVHPEAAYQRVVDVIDLVKKLKVDNFSFSMAEGLP